MSTILLVDDDVELCELVSEFLSGEGFSVVVAYDGRSGLDRARNGDFDLVILDYRLPEDLL